MTELSMLTLNIANPSPARAKLQLDWLSTRPEHVMVLTETKASRGCSFLADSFRNAGYAVFDSQPDVKRYGVMIIAKVEAASDHFSEALDYLPSRATSCQIMTSHGPIRVVGAYVPSRDASHEKINRKRRWLATFDQALSGKTHQAPMVLLADLNVLEPDHRPHYRFFAEFEYNFYRSLSSRHGLVDAYRYRHPDAVEHSWVGRTGDGYRYDHAFCAESLRSQVSACNYDHSPRLEKLSDHSALTLKLKITASKLLSVTNPVAATVQPTLF